MNESDEVERVLPGWRALAESVAEELTAWRRAHPRATLTEIEAVVFEGGQYSVSPTSKIMGRGRRGGPASWPASIASWAGGYGRVCTCCTATPSPIRTWDV